MNAAFDTVFAAFVLAMVVVVMLVVRSALHRDRATRQEDQQDQAGPDGHLQQGLPRS